MIYPISFSIPESKIVSELPVKTRFLALYKPGQGHTYDTEEEYYKGYQEALFGWTMKKAGWDCLRHYEILANGCIPWFPNLKECPNDTMTNFPKQKIFEAMKTLKDLSDPRARVLAQELLDYTRKHLTTKATANYILKSSGHESAKKILYLAPHQMVDYLRCLCLHGFKEIFGANCHEFPRVDHMYSDYTLDIRNCYGKGMTVTKNLDPSLRDSTLDVTIQQDIEQHNYDCIIFGSLHRGMPFLDIVLDRYKPSEIIFLCGEDSHDHGNIPERMFDSMGCHVFIREL